MPIQIESFGTDIHQKQNLIVGIDLGTTNSLVSIVINGVPQILVSPEGNRLIPSVVSFQSGRPVVGSGAKKRKVRDSKETVFSVKRLLGRNFEDLKETAKSLPYEIIPSEGVVRVRVNGQDYTAIEISAMILRELKRVAEAALGTSVHRAVITVPAYFNDSQRQATRAAGRLAGFDVLRMVNEPTAASLAYGLDKKRQGLIAVYDLGGGTFDISILKLQDGIFEVLSTHGDTALGGDDIDQALARVAAVEIQAKWGVDCFANSKILAGLLEAAEMTKISLSEKSEALFEVSIEGKVFQKTWTTQEFEQLVQPILEQTREPCLRALQDAGLKAADISDVVLVGGPTRLKVVQNQVKAIFGREPNSSIHPDEVVAQGAAIQADILAGNNKDLLLLDVVPLSLGLETYGGLMSALIPRNTRIPTVARENFTTFVDRQTGVDIHILQGEREKVEDNRSLARFKLTGIEPQMAGQPRIEVTFLIDADGILQVAAKDLKTGNEQSIEVKPSYGLTDAEVEKMLLTSMENVESDSAHRHLVDARNEAEPVLRAVEKSLSEARRILPSSEMGEIEEARGKLKEALVQTDIQAIQNARRELDKTTIHLAELLLKKTITLATKPK